MDKIKLCSVAAVAEDGVIGKDNGLPWRLPNDFKWFKQITKGGVIIMGRKTWDSLPKKPLPGRYNIIVTSQHDIENTETTFATKYLMGALSEAFRAAGKRNLDKVFVIGGEQIYNAYKDMIDIHYITSIVAKIEGDAHYPKLNLEDFDIEIVQDAPSCDDTDEYQFFVTKVERKSV